MRRYFARIGSCVLLVVSMTAVAQQAASGPPENSKDAPSGMGAGNPFWPTIADAVDYKNDTQPARINSINFYGNQKLSRDALLPVVGITTGQVMQPELMGKAIDAIKAQYAAKGLQVEVRPRVSHPKQNFVDVNFLINETGTTP